MEKIPVTRIVEVIPDGGAWAKQQAQEKEWVLVSKNQTLLGELVPVASFEDFPTLQKKGFITGFTFHYYSTGSAAYRTKKLLTLNAMI